MLDETLTLAVGLVDRYGIAALFVAFALEGALVGTVLPTRVLFLGIAVAVGPAPVDLFPAVAAAVAGATIGQTALFVLIRRFAVDPATDP